MADQGGKDETIAQGIYRKFRALQEKRDRRIDGMMSRGQERQPKGE